MSQAKSTDDILMHMCYWHIHISLLMLSRNESTKRDQMRPPCSTMYAQDVLFTLKTITFHRTEGYTENRVVSGLG